LIFAERISAAVADGKMIAVARSRMAVASICRLVSGVMGT